MRRALLCCMGLAWVVAVWAQDAPPQGLEGVAAEFEGIQATRARETAALDAEEAACYQRFAVSGCVKEVQSRRRAMLANLRRQEATLHERESAQRGAAQRARSQQKAADKKLQDAQLLADHSGDDAAQKLPVQHEKRAEYATRTPQPSASVTSTAASQAGAPTPAEQAANRNSFARKQADAQKKRQEIAKRLADKGGKSAAPLPLPE